MTRLSCRWQYSKKLKPQPDGFLAFYIFFIREKKEILCYRCASRANCTFPDPTNNVCGIFKPVVNPLDMQVGGSHYKDLKIQPIEFILENKIGFCEGNAIEYICQHKSKNGAQDIEKAIQYLQILLKNEYGR